MGNYSDLFLRVKIRVKMMTTVAVNFVVRNPPLKIKSIQSTPWRPKILKIHYSATSNGLFSAAIKSNFAGNLLHSALL